MSENNINIFPRERKKRKVSQFFVLFDDGERKFFFFPSLEKKTAFSSETLWLVLGGIIPVQTGFKKMRSLAANILLKS